MRHRIYHNLWPGNISILFFVLKLLWLLKHDCFMTTLKVASLNLFRTLKTCLPVSPYLLIINKAPLNHNGWVVLPEIGIIILRGIRVCVIWSERADWRSIMTSQAVVLQHSGFKMEKGFEVQVYISIEGTRATFFCLFSPKQLVYIRKNKISHF